MRQKLLPIKLSFADLTDEGKVAGAASKAQAGHAVFVTFTKEQWNDRAVTSKAAKISREHGFLLQPTA